MHPGFEMAVEGTGCLIEDQDFGLAQYCPGQGKALTLAAAKAVAVFTDHGGVARGQLVDEFGGTGSFRCSVDVRLRCMGSDAEGDVGRDRVMDKQHVLTHHTQLALPAFDI